MMVLEWNEDTESFLKYFEGNTIFISMSDTKDDKPWHFHDGFMACVETLEFKQKEGWGAFFTVNELDREKDPTRHRTLKMWIRSRALFMDDDTPRDAPRMEWPIAPSVIVESSKDERGSKFHYYWIMDQSSVVWDEVERDIWQRIQIGLCESADGDMSARDLARYLRLPGSKHCKKFIANKDGDGKSNFDELWTVRWAEVSGKAYDWELLKKVMPIADVESVRRSRGGSGVGMNKIGGKTNDQMIAEIMSGRDYHGDLLNLAYQFKQDGMNDSANIAALRGFMNAVPADLKDGRWQERYDDIPRVVAGAEKIDRYAFDYGQGLNKEEMAEISFKITTEEELRRAPGDIPWPPGDLGGLAGDAYDFAHYQYKELAVITVVGLIAGIAGRKFNISDTGLNVHLTVIMHTGAGKDSIGKFIRSTLMSLNETGNSSSFVGPLRFTGPKSIGETLKSQRSMVCVFTEAGLLMSSKAGDMMGLSRILLSLYTCSGKNDWSGKEAYSNADDSIGSMRAPALTIINEATPQTLHAAFKEHGALERGDLPRQSIYRVDRDKPLPNDNRRPEVGDYHKQRLMMLINKCAPAQAADNPHAYDLKFNDDILEDVKSFEKRMVKMENELREIDNVKSIMLSRAPIKAKKFAAIATVYNKRQDHINSRGERDALVIDRPEWEWAKAMIEYEINGVGNFFAGSSHGGNPTMEIIGKIVAPAIVKLLRGDYASVVNNKDLDSGSKARSEGKFLAVAIRQVLKKNKELNALDDNPQQRNGRIVKGIDKILQLMMDLDYIRQVEQRPLTYQVTRGFASIYEPDIKAK